MNEIYESTIFLEVVSIGGKKQVVYPFRTDLQIGKVAEQIAYQQGVEYLTPKQYVIADAFSGEAYDSNAPISQIPEFSSIRLIPTGAATGHHYLLKRFSPLYLIWLCVHLLLFLSALFKFPNQIYEQMSTFTWILLDIMLFAILLAAFVGTVKKDLVYVTDPGDFAARVETASKHNVTIAALSLVMGSLVCGISFQLGLGNWISVIRGTVASIVLGAIVFIASAFANRD